MEPISVRRARRAELGVVFGLIQQFDGSRLSPQQIMERATSYGYLVAESESQLAAVAGLLLTNSVACVRDLATLDLASNTDALLALLAAIEREAADMACEVVLVSLPAAAESLEPLLRERRYAFTPLEQMKGFWRDVTAEHFPDSPGLWVFSLRSREE